MAIPHLGVPNSWGSEKLAGPADDGWRKRYDPNKNQIKNGSDPVLKKLIDWRYVLLLPATKNENACRSSNSTLLPAFL